MAEIHRASKEGQCYDVGGGAPSCSAQAEPPAPTEYDIRPASQVYSVSGIRVPTPSLGLGQVPLALSWHHSPGPGTPGQALAFPTSA